MKAFKDLMKAAGNALVEEATELNKILQDRDFNNPDYIECRARVEKATRALKVIRKVVEGDA